MFKMYIINIIINNKMESVLEKINLKYATINSINNSENMFAEKISLFNEILEIYRDTYDCNYDYTNAIALFFKKVLNLHNSNTTIEEYDIMYNLLQNFGEILNARKMKVDLRRELYMFDKLSNTIYSTYRNVQNGIITDISKINEIEETRDIIDYFMDMLKRLCRLPSIWGDIKYNMRLFIADNKLNRMLRITNIGHKKNYFNIADHIEFFRLLSPYRMYNSIMYNINHFSPEDGIHIINDFLDNIQININEYVEDEHEFKKYTYLFQLFDIISTYIKEYAEDAIEDDTASDNATEYITEILKMFFSLFKRIIIQYKLTIELDETIFADKPHITISQYIDHFADDMLFIVDIKDVFRYFASMIKKLMTTRDSSLELNFENMTQDENSVEFMTNQLNELKFQLKSYDEIQEQLRQHIFKLENTLIDISADKSSEYQPKRKERE